MPTTADRLLRDFIRYTGDGLPDAPVGHPLPVGDPASGVHHPAKKDLRDAINSVVGSADVADAAAARANAAAMEIETELAGTREWVNGGPLPGGADDYIGRVVVIGSSTLAGQGATGFVAPSEDNGWTEAPQSCVGLLRAALGSRAEIINRSGPGTNMYNQRQEFWSRVAPYRPRFVIIGTGLVNENGDTGERKAANYLRHMTAIVAMCRSIGATPIWWGGNPMQGLDTRGRHAIRAIKRCAAEMGVRVWDMSASTAADDYTFLSGLNVDNLHANNTGHRYYFEAANLGDFRAWDVLPVRPRPPRYRLGMTAGNVSPAFYAQTEMDEDAPYSWTVYARINRPAAISGYARRLLTVQFADGAERLRIIRSASGFYEVQQGDTALITTAVSASGAGTDRVMLRYHAQGRTLRLFLGGVEAGEASNFGGSLRMSGLTFGGVLGDAAYPATGCYIEDLRCWRVPFLFQDRASIFDGDRPCEGLVLDVSFDHSLSGTAINMAGNTTFRCDVGPTGDWVLI